MFTATLFIIPRNWRQPRCFQGLSRFKGYGTSNPMEHSSAVKINELIYITTCVNLQRIVFHSVAKSCPTLCDPMDCSTPGFSVLHYLLEFVQTHGHSVGDAIQPSHPLPPSSFAFSLSQHWGLSRESALHIRWPKYWSFSFSNSPSSEYLGLISFRIDCFDLLAVQRIILSEKESQLPKFTQCVSPFI